MAVSLFRRYLRALQSASILLVCVLSQQVANAQAGDEVITEYSYDQAGNIVGEVSYFDRLATELELEPSEFRRDAVTVARASSKGSGNLRDVEIVTEHDAIAAVSVTSSLVDANFELQVGGLVPLGTQTLAFINDFGTIEVPIEIRPVLPLLSLNPSVLRFAAGQALSLDLGFDAPDNRDQNFTISVSDPAIVGTSSDGFTIPSGAVTPTEPVELVGITPGSARITLTSHEVPGPSRMVQLIPQEIPAAKGVLQVGVGRRHSCAILVDSTVSCWGSNGDGQALPPSGEFVEIDAGGSFTCALDADDAIKCWGLNTDDSLAPPDGKFDQLSTGGYHACALREGRVTCWGSDSVGQASPLSGEFIEISAGGGHTCGIRMNKSVECWGDDTSGESSPPPGQFTTVASGFRRTCAIDLAGEIQCWGSSGSPSSSPIVQNNGPTQKDSPLAPSVVPEGTFSALDVGEYNACALRVDGKVVCWGSFSNNGRDVGDGPAGNFASVSTGPNHICAASSTGGLICWGMDDAGQATSPSREVAQVSLGSNHACAIQVDGLPKCWGSNRRGEAEPLPETFVRVAAGGNHTCALTDADQIRCWGSDRDGQATPPDGKFIDLASGSAHSCAVRSDGQVLCWGRASSGQTSPPDGRYFQVTAAGDHSCALRIDKTAVCWGALPLDEEPPLDLPALLHIETGVHNTCGLGNNGDLFCWGSDSHGQSVPPTGSFIEVSVGNGHACAQRTDGEIVCWGNNGDGRLDVPDADFVRVVAGSGVSCGILRDTGYQCWGSGTALGGPIRSHGGE